MKLMFALSIMLLGTNDLLLNAKDVTVKYDVKGMMCSMNCPNFIKEGASRIDGVKKCEVDFDKGSATIYF